LNLKALLIWVGVSILILVALTYNENLWPLGFIIPILVIVVGIIYSFRARSNLYGKSAHSSRLVGRLSYGIDRKGKPSKKFHF
jgi:peptidoglycan/LPS O-acetylase OafA/YrhL